MGETSNNTPLVPTPKTGNEPFHLGGQQQKDTVLDFWRWAASDLVNNAMRGKLAEYIVARALGLVQNIRVEWDAYDLITAGGTKVEVKSAAYLQAWAQKKHSAISFGIRPTRAWEPDTSAYVKECRRQADVYVFCLLHHQDKATLDPLNLEQWTFFVLPTAKLNTRHPAQKTIRLTALLLLNPVQAGYENLTSALEYHEETNHDDYV